MNELVEIRSTNVAFEMRNGVRVEYANGDREKRMCALGCPEAILKRVREKRSAARKVSTDAEILEANKSYANILGRKIAEHTDADLRTRAARLGQIIAADAEQEKKDDDLRARMENASGRTCRTRGQV
jgi:hypothetical protein